MTNLTPVSLLTLTLLAITGCEDPYAIQKEAEAILNPPDPKPTPDPKPNPKADKI